jgi:hypothetical protein
MTVPNGAPAWCPQRGVGIARSLVYSVAPRMSLTRSVAILLATVTLLSTSGVAYAASSRLTPTPPTGFSSTPAKSKSEPPTSIPATSTSARPTGAIPRTGSDLRLELLVALLLIVVGAILRSRLTVGRT